MLLIFELGFLLLVFIFPIVILTLLQPGKLAFEKILISFALYWILLIIFGYLILIFDDFQEIILSVFILSFFSFLIILIVKNLKSSQKLSWLHFKPTSRYSIVLIIPLAFLWFYRTKSIFPLPENIDFNTFELTYYYLRQLELIGRFDNKIILCYLIIIILLVWVIFEEKNPCFLFFSIMLVGITLLVDPTVRLGRPWGIDSYYVLTEMNLILNGIYTSNEYILVSAQTQFTVILQFVKKITGLSTLNIGLYFFPFVNSTLFFILFLFFKGKNSFYDKSLFCFLVFSPLMLQIQRIGTTQTLGFFFFLSAIYIYYFQTNISKNWSFLFGILTTVHQVTALMYISFLFLSVLFNLNEKYNLLEINKIYLSILSMLLILEFEQFFYYRIETNLDNSIILSLISGPVFYQSGNYPFIIMKFRVFILLLLVISYLFVWAYYLKFDKYLSKSKSIIIKNFHPIFSITHKGKVFLSFFLGGLVIIFGAIAVTILGYQTSLSLTEFFLFYLSYPVIGFLITYAFLNEYSHVNIFGTSILAILLPLIPFLVAGFSSGISDPSLFMRAAYLIPSASIGIQSRFSGDLSRNNRKILMITVLFLSICGFFGSFLLATW